MFFSQGGDDFGGFQSNFGGMRGGANRNKENRGSSKAKNFGSFG